MKGKDILNTWARVQTGCVDKLDVFLDCAMAMCNFGWWKLSLCTSSCFQR